MTDENKPGQEKNAGPGPPPAADTPAENQEPEQPAPVIRDRRRVRATGEPAEPAPAPAPAAGGLGAELEALRTELAERTHDLQRVTADFANYRKRIERDRAVAGERATGNVLRELLPVLDDLDRAREHGELVEGVAAVAEQLVATTSKFGLTPFGEPGDPFDPNRHEAVAHLTSAEVTVPTCVDVLRRGYLLGNQLLRPAMVAVADPAPPDPTLEAVEPSEPGTTDSEPTES